MSIRLQTTFSTKSDVLMRLFGRSSTLCILSDWGCMSPSALIMTCWGWSFFISFTMQFMACWTTTLSYSRWPICEKNGNQAEVERAGRFPRFAPSLEVMYSMRFIIALAIYSAIIASDGD